MSISINFKLTQAGQAAIWNAGNSGVSLSLTHVQIGSGNKATLDGLETELLAPQQSVAIAAGSRISSTQIRMSAIFTGDNTFNIAEVGLWAGSPAESGSVLVAYWSQESGNLAVKSAGVDFVFSHDMYLNGSIPDGSITILADQDQSFVLSALANHEAKIDPHPQYTTSDEASALIADAVSNKAPLLNPEFTGDPKAPTPAQFGTDTSLATTEFVQRALGSYSGFVNYNGSGAIAITDVGKHIVFDSSGGSRSVVLTTAGLVPGAVYKITRGDAVVANTLTISADGAGFIGMSNNKGGAYVTSVVMRVYDCINFIWDGLNFWCDGGHSGASLNSNGYQKLPSGLIIQWGNISGRSVGAGNYLNVEVTYPIAFPNSTVLVLASPLVGNISFASAGPNTATASGATITLMNSYTSAQSLGATWVAIGY